MRRRLFARFVRDTWLQRHLIVEVSRGPGLRCLILWSETAHKRRTFFYGPFEDFERAAKAGTFEKACYPSIYARPPGEGEKGVRKAPLVEHVSTGNVA